MTRTAQPMPVLTQLIQKQFSGYIRISTPNLFWCIYLDQGELLYGTHSSSIFRHLEYLLRRLSERSDIDQSEAETLKKALNNPTVREKFRDKERDELATPPSLEQWLVDQGHITLHQSKWIQRYIIREPLNDREKKDLAASLRPDYEVICWLLDQGYLTAHHVKYIVELMTRNSIVSLLKIPQGEIDVVECQPNHVLRRLCGLDTLEIMRSCHQHAQNSRTQTAIDANGTRDENGAQETMMRDGGDRLRPSQSLSLKAPTSNTPRATDQTPSSPGQGSDRSTRNASRKYIIGCIDDSQSVLKSLKSCLNSDTFSVFTVDNPVKALMSIMRHNPDLILLDVMMPKLDGYELCSLLRKHPKFKGMPIIIITGNTGLVNRTKAKLVQASGYLNKPFTKKELLAVMGKYLEIPSSV